MNGRPLTLPTWDRLAAGLAGTPIVQLAFFPIYLGCGAITAMRDSPLRLYADWELAIPFVPFMIVPYLSMFVLFVIPLLQLEPGEMRDLVRRLVVATLIGGIMFLALPAQLGFPERADAGIWQGWYDAIYRLDNRFNTVPSFHVIFTASILLAFIEVATPWLRRLYLIWLVFVCASTVLTHRHHLLDVAAGLAIAVAVRSLFSRPIPVVVGRNHLKEAPMRSLVLAIALYVLLGGGAASAQQGTQADHEALRKLKTDVVNAINARKLDGIDVLLHKPFMTTVITQDSFIDAAKLKAYFEGLFTRRLLRIASLHMEAEADETAQIYTGTFAVARGGTKERYDMADGNSFMIDGRWTATAMKDNGQWKVLALHTGTNFLDNPVLSAVGRSTLYVASGAGAAGVVLGFLVGFFVRRRRAKPA